MNRKTISGDIRAHVHHHFVACEFDTFHISEHDTVGPGRCNFLNLNIFLPRERILKNPLIILELEKCFTN